MASRYGLRIRAAVGSADAAEIAELARAVGHPVPAGTLAARLDALQAAGAGVALVAVEWGPPSGLVVLGWSRTLEHDLPVARISTFVVAPDERRRGIGRALLKAASQAARVAGCGLLILPVATGADPSLGAFCEATGFALEGSLYARPLRKKGEGASHA